MKVWILRRDLVYEGEGMIIVDVFDHYPSADEIAPFNLTSEYMDVIEWEVKKVIQ